MRFYRKKADYFRPTPFLPYCTSPVYWSTASNYLKNYLKYLLTHTFKSQIKLSNLWSPITPTIYFVSLILLVYLLSY